ncbi:MAG: prolipoprotein diacylglyceryl transferase [bacterium]
MNFNFLHYFQPQSIALQFGPVAIHWYGLLIVASIIISIFLLKNLAKNILTLDDLYDATLWSVLGGIIGARLYDVLIVDWNYYSNHFLEILKIWQGGLAIHGAVIGGGVALYIWSQKNKKDFFVLADLVVVILPLCQAIGRWGNYFNQELFGWPTKSIWGIPIDLAHRPIQFINNQYFWPAFLFESILDLFLFLILFFLAKKKKLKKGNLVLIYLAGYGIIRFLMEFVRIDETAMLGIWRWPQVLSGVVVIVAGGILARMWVKNRLS